MSIELGQRFGWLEVVSRAESTARRQARYLCRCLCSREVIVLGYSLSTGIKRTCGKDCKAKKEIEEKVQSIFPKFSVTTINTRGESSTHFAKK
jgi:hypothetical protein